MRTLFIVHYFEMGIIVYNAHISQIIVYIALLWTDVFWILHINCYEFYNSSLVVLGSKHGGTLKLVNWSSVQLLTLLTFLFILPRCQVIFQWKQNKKVRKYLKSVKTFLHRLRNRYYFASKLIHDSELLDITVYEVN